MTPNVISALLAATVLAGCAAVPRLGEAPKPVIAQALASGQSLAAPQGEWPADRWWEAYGDPQLNALVDEALRGSPTLAQAAARMRRAQGQAEESGARLLPQVSAQAQAAEVKQSYNNGFPRQFVPQGYNDTGRASVDVTWDLDIWGRNRAAVAAAVSEAEAARLDAEETRLMLTSSVVSAYADLARLFAERDAATTSAGNRDATAGLVAQRVTGGAANEGESSQAKAAAAAARQDLAATEEQIAIARHRLAALLGAGPDRGLSIAPPPARPERDFTLPANIAAELMGRRPDVRAARARVEAAAKRTKAVKLGFYPNVNLSAFIGLQSLGLGQLTASGSDTGQAAAAVTLPIFSAGRLEGAYRGARAEYDAAVAAYDETLVRALQEVADAAASARALDTRLKSSREALAAAENAYRIARLRYDAGLASYLTVLSSEDAVIAQRRTVADVEARALTLDAQLARALGGGFRPRA